MAANSESGVPGPAAPRPPLTPELERVIEQRIAEIESRLASAQELVLCDPDSDDTAEATTAFDNHAPDDVDWLLELVAALRAQWAASTETELPRLRNALCVLLDHLTLGEAGVLQGDIPWVTEIVESFASATPAAPRAGGGPSPKQENA